VTSAVLISAGLDSAVLAAFEVQRGPVHPLYVSAGLSWEASEVAALKRLLTAPSFSRLAPLVTLAFTVTDLYPPGHWALRGEPPAFDTPDRDVYLVGRNVALLAQPFTAPGTGLGASCSARSPGIRFPMRRASSSMRWHTHCRSAWRT
jgi:hypothetical protein